VIKITSLDSLSKHHFPWLDGQKKTHHPKVMGCLQVEYLWHQRDTASAGRYDGTTMVIPCLTAAAATFAAAALFAFALALTAATFFTFAFTPMNLMGFSGFQFSQKTFWPLK
jgi:hypothetical protein